MRRKLLMVLGTTVVGAVGFVGASLAAGTACTPGTVCGSTQTQTATTGRGSTGTNPGTTSRGSTQTTATTRPVESFRPTLKLSRSSLDFGGPVILSGRVAGAPAGSSVDIIQQACGFTGAQTIATVKTRSNGMFTYVIEPQRNATFMARYASLLSAAQTLWVRPAVQLRRVSPSLFEVDVSAGGGSYFSKNVVLERYDSGHRRWRTVALNRLKESSPPDALIAVSSTRIKAAVPSGTKLRATAAQSAVGGCYRAAHSPAITG